MANGNSVFFQAGFQRADMEAIFIGAIVMHWLKAVIGDETGWVNFVKMVFERWQWKQMLAFHLCICKGPLLGFPEK